MQKKVGARIKRNKEKTKNKVKEEIKERKRKVEKIE